MEVKIDKKTMKSLRNIAACVSVPITRVTKIYKQVAVLGELQGLELRDFAMTGIPLAAELSKNLGKTKDQIQKMITSRKIAFSEVEKAFRTMTDEGGVFFNSKKQ